MRYILVVLVLLSSFSVEAQQSIQDYPPAQKQALEAFLASHPDYQFKSEVAFDAKTLKAAREEWGFGKSFKPYYQSGDFNRDGIQDFAAVLDMKKGGKKEAYVLIFNGTKDHQYRVAYNAKEDSAPALFISSSKKGLFVSVMETDSAGCFVSKGEGYQVKPCGN